MQKVNRLWFEFLNDVKVLWIRSNIFKVANTHTILLGNIECELKDYLTILKRERFNKPFHKFAIRIGGNGVHGLIAGVLIDSFKDFTLPQ